MTRQAKHPTGGYEHMGCRCAGCRAKLPPLTEADWRCVFELRCANAGQMLAAELRAYYDMRRLDEREWLGWLEQALATYERATG